MKSLTSFHVAVMSLVLLTVIALCGCSNKTGEPASNESSSATSSSSASALPSESATTSPSESATASANPSTSPTTQVQGVAPQGTTCPSDSPIKAVISKRLGKIALTTKSPRYSKVKPEKCFPDTASAQQAGYKVPK